jgi:opacity protein-like surface antigen
MLANAAYDYPLDDRFSLTVGAGIGLASVSPRLSALPVSINPLIVGGAPQSTQVELARHIETSFAWQLLIGVMYSLRNDLDVQMDYRYHGNDDTTHTTSLARISPVKVQDDHVQALMFSVRYYP